MEEVMFRHSVLYAVTITTLIAGSSFAQSLDRGSEDLASTTVSEPRSAPDIAPLRKSEDLGRDEARAASHAPTRALLVDIVTWLAAKAGMPAHYELPRVELMPVDQLAGKRSKRFSAVTQKDASNYTAVHAATHREVMAVYNDKTRTIFLADTWTGRTPVEVSILVHEMVHHLQSLGNLKYECLGAREKPAYLAQDQWLRQFGLSLEQVFEIDAFTLLVVSACLQ
jgi:hypothetical protein